MKKVYLAGPDVFRRNAVEYFNELEIKIKNRGFIPLSPIDSELNNTSYSIYEKNISLIKECDYVLANLDPFRSPSVDPGTAFEIGYAKALGKKVIGYYPNGLPDVLKNRTSEKCFLNEKYPIVEDFDLMDNLMIHHSCYLIACSLNSAIDSLV